MGKNVSELKDLLNRQNAILQNRRIISTLADKGEKVRQRQQMLKDMIEMRESSSVDRATNLLGKLAINGASNGIDTNKMEWQLGGANLMNKYGSIKALDSDDESDRELEPEDYIENDPDFEKNPLKILASRSEVSRHKSKNTYASSLAEKADIQTKNSNSDLDSRFVPFKSLRNEKLSEENKLVIEKSLTKTNHANTKSKELMPLPSNKYSYLKAKTVNIEESVTLQKQQAKKLQEIQFKQAAERLASCVSGEKESVKLFLSETKKMAYRDPQLEREPLDDTNVGNVSEYLNNEDDDDSEIEDGVRISFTQEEIEHPN